MFFVSQNQYQLGTFFKIVHACDFWKLKQKIKSSKQLLSCIVIAVFRKTNKTISASDPLEFPAAEFLQQF